MGVTVQAHPEGPAGATQRPLGRTRAPLAWLLGLRPIRQDRLQLWVFPPESPRLEGTRHQPRSARSADPGVG